MDVRPEKERAQKGNQVHNPTEKAPATGLSLFFEGFPAVHYLAEFFCFPG
jgi:hypothetical protein